MKKNIILIFIVFITCGLYGCGSTRKDNPDPLVTRSFFMGFTPFPYEATVPATQETYNNINLNSDIIAHHFDGGVPWVEAATNASYNTQIEENISFRKLNTSASAKTYLATTPINTYRNDIANYWGAQENMMKPFPWDNYTFADAEIKTAYLNYCLRMISEFNPNYMAYGIEVNALDVTSPNLIDDYVLFNEFVYSQIKVSYPNLPLFLTFSLGIFNDFQPAQTSFIQKMLPYTDYIAISHYPFQNYENPENIPNNIYDNLLALAPNKPFAVAETAFIAEDLVLPTKATYISGNATYQDSFLNWLFEQGNKYNAEFLIYWQIRDYDQLWESIVSINPGVDELFKTWKDTGLLDGSGTPRKSLDTWESWLSLPKQ